jgi:DNA-directed RNA polymerase subunit M/transcription elongation factor TFIIS
MLTTHEEYWENACCPNCEAVGTIEVKRKILSGDPIGGTYKCNSCGKEWETPRFTCFPFNTPKCPDCHERLIEIKEGNGNTLICFGCGNLWDNKEIEGRKTEIYEAKLNKKTTEKEEEELAVHQGLMAMHFIIMLIATVVYFIWLRKSIWDKLSILTYESFILSAPLLLYLIVRSTKY